MKSSTPIALRFGHRVHWIPAECYRCPFKQFRLSRVLLIGGYDLKRGIRAIASMGGRPIRTSVLPALLRSRGSDRLGMQYQLGGLVTCAAVLAYAFLQRYRRSSTIRDVPGPVNPSWIFGMYPGVNATRFTSSSGSIVLNVKTRAPVVYPGRRCWRGREEVPQGLRKHRPMERFFWGASHFLPGTLSCTGLELLTDMLCTCGRIACGSQTPKPSTTSFRNPVIFMPNRAGTGNG